MVEEAVIKEPLELPEDIVLKGLELCPMKTKEEVEDEFNEWLMHIGMPSSVEKLIEKYLFFCKIKGEALNI